MSIKREICGGCTKQIYYHNKIIICNSCSTISHFQCSQNSKFQLFKSATSLSPAIWYCDTCFTHHGIKRYNPFIELLSNNVGTDDDPEVNDDLHKISKCLENCKMFETVSDFNTTIGKTFKNDETSPFSIFFNNLNGNATNFDSIAVELTKYDHKFSTIALCETNIDSTHKSLYNLQGYESIYQSKLPNKTKGSGLGLYIDEKFTHEELSDICICTPDIEALFVKITNCKEILTIGVVYRPPSGNFNRFRFELERILLSLPKKNVYISGDFNVNLHNIDDDYDTKKFEETIMTTGFAPSVSVWTHHMPNHIETCIDNILTNNFSDHLITGTIEDSVSHHLPLFLISDIICCNLDNKTDASETKIQYRYVFNQMNTSNLQDKVINIVAKHSNNTDFNDLMREFGDAVESTCREEIICNSKRNNICNPWITPGIIISSNKKHKMHKQWEKTKKNRKDPNDKGDLAL